MIRGGLFTRFFLEDGIRQMPEYNGLSGAAVTDFAKKLRRLWSSLSEMAKPTEPETEAEFILPVLGLLGWEHLPQQEPGRGRRDVADALLFLDEESKARARP